MAGEILQNKLKIFKVKVYIYLHYIMSVNGRLTGVNETAVCGACAVPATNLREWSMRLGRVIHVVVIAARRSSAVASGR